MSKVWFITGTSKGFGRVWAEAALERGDRVAATARNADTLTPLVEHLRRQRPAARARRHRQGRDRRGRQADARALRPARRRRQQRRLRPVRRDRGGHRAAGPRPDRDQPVRPAVGHARRRSRSCASRARAHHPGLLDRRRERVPDIGLYHASKWGLEGFSQSLAAEVAGFGIKVTIVEPAGFSTDWRGPSAVVADQLPSTGPCATTARGVHRRVAEPGDPQATGRRSSSSSTPTSRRCACSSAPARWT